MEVAVWIMFLDTFASAKLDSLALTVRPTLMTAGTFQTNSSYSLACANYIQQSLSWFRFLTKSGLVLHKVHNRYLIKHWLNSTNFCQPTIESTIYTTINYISLVFHDLITLFQHLNSIWNAESLCICFKQGYG